jgi:hypothetical protein
MTFRLIDKHWAKELRQAFILDHSRLAIVCPFIKLNVIKELLKRYQPHEIQVITRFNQGEFASGINDLSALELLLGKGAHIRGVKNLHAKLYLFGATRAISTSANLTFRGLNHNHEFGFASDEASVITGCRSYFDGLWSQAGESVTLAKIEKWKSKVDEAIKNRADQTKKEGLADEGVDIGFPSSELDAISGLRGGLSDQAIVKFTGLANDRVSRTTKIREVLRGSGHAYVGFPEKKVPRQIQDGATMYIARMTQNPNDHIIYGRALAMAYKAGRDDASPEDIKRFSWTEKWCRFIRLQKPEYVAGTLENGVSLADLMRRLGPNSFMSTAKNASEGIGNTEPSRSIMQKAAIELTPVAHAWLDQELNFAMDKFGRFAPDETS